MIKEKIHGANSARFIYYSYKDSPYYSLLVLSIILSIGIILVFSFVLPQLESFISLRDETIAARGRISILKSNLTFLSSMNTSLLESHRATIINALPVEKDFTSIINAISSSSRATGIVVDDYTFGLGPLSPDKPSPATQNQTSEFVYIKLSLKGKITDIKNFMKEMNAKLPLSEVDLVEAKDKTAFVTFKFFSKAYKAPSINREEPINPISAQNGLLINKLNNWRSQDLQVVEEVAPERDEQKPLF